VSLALNLAGPHRAGEDRLAAQPVRKSVHAGRFASLASKSGAKLKIRSGILNRGGAKKIVSIQCAKGLNPAHWCLLIRPADEACGRRLKSNT
jgi:hypothetical protein